MTENSLHDAPLKPRRTARDRFVRRARIMDGVREGRSYEDIAEAEGLSRERIRQIVVEALGQTEVESQRDHAQLQMLRLAPALRLASKDVAGGDRKAIPELIRVLDRLDKYQAVNVTTASYDEGARERLLNKLDTMARRMKIKLPHHAGFRSLAEREAEAAATEAAAENAAATLPWGLKP